MEHWNNIHELALLRKYDNNIVIENSKVLGS